VRFARFFSGGFNTVMVVNPPERRLTKRSAVISSKEYHSAFEK
jgi:hypothetical protein